MIVFWDWVIVSIMMIGLPGSGNGGMVQLASVGNVSMLVKVAEPAPPLIMRPATAAGKRQKLCLH